MVNCSLILSTCYLLNACTHCLEMCILHALSSHRTKILVSSKKLGILNIFGFDSIFRVNIWDLGALKKVLSMLNTFEFFANFKCTQCFLSMLNMILSIHKKLSMLKKFEYAWIKFWGSRQHLGSICCIWKKSNLKKITEQKNFFAWGVKYFLYNYLHASETIACKN